VIGTAEKWAPLAGLVMMAGEEIGGALIEAVTNTSSALTPNEQASKKAPAHSIKRITNGYGNKKRDLFFFTGRRLAVFRLGIFVFGLTPKHYHFLAGL
jgi:hypothetical protein